MQRHHQACPQEPPRVPARALEPPPRGAHGRQGPQLPTVAVCPRLPFRTVLISPAVSQRDGRVLRWGKQSCQGLRDCFPSVTQSCSLQGHSPPCLSCIEVPEFGGTWQSWRVKIKGGGWRRKVASTPTPHPPPDSGAGAVFQGRASLLPS